MSARMCKDMYIYGHVLVYPHVGCAAVEDTEGDLHTILKDQNHTDHVDKCKQ